MNSSHTIQSQLFPNNFPAQITFICSSAYFKNIQNPHSIQSSYTAHSHISTKQATITTTNRIPLSTLFQTHTHPTPLTQTFFNHSLNTHPRSHTKSPSKKSPIHTPSSNKKKTSKLYRIVVRSPTGKTQKARGEPTAAATAAATTYTYYIPVRALYARALVPFHRFFSGCSPSLAARSHTHTYMHTLRRRQQRPLAKIDAPTRAASGLSLSLLLPASRPRARRRKHQSSAARRASESL